MVASPSFPPSPASPASSNPARVGAAVDRFRGELAGGLGCIEGRESRECGQPAPASVEPRRAWGPRGGEIAAVDPPLSLMKFKFV